MGLDWNPLGKPKPGMEAEFYRLLGQLGKAEHWVQPVPFHFENIDESKKDALLDRFFAIQISPYETLNPPRVGRDAKADAWILSKYDDAPNKPPTKEEWLKKFNGFYAMELLPECDGLPVYSNYSLGSYWERWSFRAQFLDRFCEDVLGETLLTEAFLNHLPDQLADYGKRLMNCARAYAKIHDVSHILTARRFSREEEAAGVDSASPLYKTHIIASAARWAAFWSSRGHGMTTDY